MVILDVVVDVAVVVSCVDVCDVNVVVVDVGLLVVVVCVVVVVDDGVVVELVVIVV